MKEKLIESIKKQIEVTKNEVVKSLLNDKLKALMNDKSVTK